MHNPISPSYARNNEIVVDRPSIIEKVVPSEVHTVKTGYVPRKLQNMLHSALKRFNVLVCHRRFGKTVFAINELIDQAVNCTLKNPQYAYIAPTYREAKRIAWQYFIDYTRSIPGVRANKTELTVYIDRTRINEFGIEEPDVIKLMLIGADDPDDLRGIYLDGSIIDEFAKCDPILWGQIVRQALADRPGWCIFIGTPKGQNHFFLRYVKAQEHEKYTWQYKLDNDINEKREYYRTFEKDLGLHENLNEPETRAILETIPKTEQEDYAAWRKFLVASQWFTTIQKASLTGILDRLEIEEMTEDLEQNEIDQELECDFAAAILGSYYGKKLSQATKDGRITKLMYNPNYPVDTYWDIGVNDKTTIWFVQKIRNNYHYIDYIEDNGKGISEYMKMLDDKPYKYGRHIWPHDGRVQEFGTGVTRQETAIRLGLKRLEIQPKQAVQDQIEAARKRLSISWFDAEKCARGLTCLTNFQKEWNSKLQKFDDKPKKDWSHHAASSFQYSSLDNRVSSFDDSGQHQQTDAIMEYDEFA